MTENRTTMTYIRPKPYEFPRYDRVELLADRVVHLVGTALALGGVVWLISRLPPDASTKLTASIWIYASSLLSMLSASALYNLVAARRIKSKLRRLDHAMIFVMIAASYTPFALNAFPKFSGHLLLGIIWALAIAGVILKFSAVPQSGFLSVGLYIAMGWVVLGFLPVLISSVAEPSPLLLLFGGIVYSAGALIHAWSGFRFHNAIWHTMVLSGAALHFGAIALLVQPDLSVRSEGSGIIRVGYQGGLNAAGAHGPMCGIDPRGIACGLLRTGRDMTAADYTTREIWPTRSGPLLRR